MKRKGKKKKEGEEKESFPEGLVP